MKMHKTLCKQALVQSPWSPETVVWDHSSVEVGQEIVVFWSFQGDVFFVLCLVLQLSTDSHNLPLVDLLWLKYLERPLLQH